MPRRKASRSCRKTCPPVKYCSKNISYLNVSLSLYSTFLCLGFFFFVSFVLSNLKEGNTLSEYHWKACRVQMYIFRTASVLQNYHVKFAKRKPGNAPDKQRNIREVVSGMPLKSEKATRKPAPLNLLAKHKAQVSVLQVCVFNSVCARMCFSVHTTECCPRSLNTSLVIFFQRLVIKNTFTGLFMPMIQTMR